MENILSIVIPVKNEGENIEPLLRSVRQAGDDLAIGYEIIVVDGGSIDETVSRARPRADQVVIQKNPGYGNALKEGFSLSSGKYLLTLDGDLSHPPHFISALYRERAAAELIIASRYVAGGSAEMPWWRKVLSKILNIVFGRVLSLPVRDVSSGFRLYRADVLKNFALRARDFSILEEIAIKMWNRGYRIKEVPFEYRPRLHGYSKAKLLGLGRSYLRTAYSMWKLRNSCDTADYDDRAFNSIIPPQRFWQRRRFRIVKEFISGRTKILDIGCGSSNIVKSLPGAVGLDISPAKLRYLRSFLPRLVNASIFHLPFAPRSFDGLICSEVIEHVPFHRDIFCQFNDLLRDDGILVLGTPDYGRLSWRIIEYFYGLLMPNAYKDEHVTHYTMSRLRALLQEHGFEIEDYDYIAGSELIIKARKVR